jgi:hypothetical protein
VAADRDSGDPESSRGIGALHPLHLDQDKNRAFPLRKRLERRTSAIDDGGSHVPARQLRVKDAPVDGVVVDQQIVNKTPSAKTE